MRPLAFSVLLTVPAALGAQDVALARACSRLGDARHPDARSAVQQAAQGAGAPADFARGCLAMADRQWATAVGAFERAVAAADGSAVAHFWLGRAYGEQAQRANVLRQASLARKTKGHFDRAVQIDPEYLDAREGLLQYYLLAPGMLGGSEEKARAQAEEIRRRDPYRGAFAAGRIAARRKAWGEAAREYDGLAAQFPDSAAPWLSLVSIHAQQRRWDEVFRIADRLQRVQPGSTLALYLAGRAAAETGEQLERGDEALTRYLAAQRKPGEPAPANAHWRRGAIRERQGRRDLARADYEAALRLDPELKAAREAIARLR
jgi:tetratricopeptide (TPR) repeat protein